MVKKVVHKNIVLLIVAVAQFMVVLDSSIVNVALPSIYKALHFTSTGNLQWIVTAYTLAFGGFLLLGGRAADLYGRKKLFVIAVSLFAAMSLLTGLSQSPLMIGITRAVQGLTAAFMSPAALSIVLTTFKEGKERAKALSVWGAVAAGGAAAGVLLGGILTQYLDWRWNFFVNVPVGIVIAFAAFHYVPESKADLDHRKLDIPGAILVTAGLMALVYSFTQAPTWGWVSAKTLEMLGASVVLLALFIWNEARSKHALMPLTIFRVANVSAANLTMLPIAAAMFSMFFFVSLYVQQVLGYSPVQSGLSFLPITFVIGGISVMMQHVIGRVGYKKPLVIAPFFITGGLLYLSHFITVGGSYWADVFPGLILMACGMGMTFIAVTIAATNGVPHREAGLASGLLNTSQQVGGSLGLAILSGIATSAAASYTNVHVGAVSALAKKGASTQQLGQATKQLAFHAQVNGFHHALLVGAFFAVFSFLVAAIFIRHHQGEEIDANPVPGV